MRERVRHLLYGSVAIQIGIACDEASKPAAAGDVSASGAATGLLVEAPQTAEPTADIPQPPRFEKGEEVLVGGNGYVARMKVVEVTPTMVVTEGIAFGSRVEKRPPRSYCVTTSRCEHTTRSGRRSTQRASPSP